MSIEITDENRPPASPQDLEKAAKIRSTLHAKQRQSEADESTQKSLIAGRRGGKTYGEAADLLIHALENPLANNLFVTLAKSHARTLLWDNPKTGLKVLNRLFDVGLHMDNTKAIATLPNGALISLHGASKADELEKIRGRANDRVKVDECASFAPLRLKNLVDNCIVPTLADYNGRLTLSGTPGSVPAGPWWDSTSIYVHGENPFKNEKPRCVAFDKKHLAMPGEYEWVCHRYNFEDNVALPGLREFAYGRKLAKRWGDDDPSWVREWLGFWLIDFEALVYRYKPEYDWSGGVIPRKADWRYVMSLYWGKTGTVGIVVLAYSETTHGLWQVAERKIEDATLRSVASTIRKFDGKFGIDEMVGARYGNLDKIFEDLADLHGIYINVVSTKGKVDLQVLANEDMDMAMVHMLKDSELRSEALRLQWKDPGVKEDLTYISNELSSAFTFGWRFCYHRGPRTSKNKGPEKGTREHDEQMAERELIELERQVAGENSSDWLAGELGDIDGTAIFDD
jgi:hypothetical protein